MTALSLLRANSAGILIAAGLAKLVSTDQMAKSLESLLPRRRRSSISKTTVRAIGVVEIVGALAVLALPPGWIREVLGILIAAVLGGTGLALRLKNHGNCGCFGRARLPFASTTAALGAITLAGAAFERAASETSSMLLYSSIAVLLTCVLYMDILGNLLIKGR